MESFVQILLASKWAENTAGHIQIVKYAYFCNSKWLIFRCRNLLVLFNAELITDLMDLILQIQFLWHADLWKIKGVAAVSIPESHKLTVKNGW